MYRQGGGNWLVRVVVPVQIVADRQEAVADTPAMALSFPDSSLRSNNDLMTCSLSKI